MEFAAFAVMVLGYIYVLARLAMFKNRSAVGWVVFGVLMPFSGLLILMFAHPLNNDGSKSSLVS